MYDKLIQKIFPDQHSVFSSDLREPVPTDDLPNFFKPVNLDIYSLDFFRGDIVVSDTLGHYGATFFPSSYCRKNLLFLQLLSSATFGKKHYTKRKDMPSYLLAQTFYGSGHLRYEGCDYELNPNDIFIIDCRKEHEYYATSSGGWGYRFLHFDGNSMPGYYSQIQANGNVNFSFGPETHMESLWENLIRINADNEPNKEIISNRIITDMITEILCQLPQYQTTELPDLVIDIRNYIDNHFTEKITLDNIAERCRVSKFYMSRTFKKYLGQSIFNYIIDSRIALAQRLLRYSEQSITSISETVGFEDHNGFYRAFMQREELSPSAYRKYWHSF